MNRRRLIVLGLVLLVLGGAAYFYHTYWRGYHGYDPVPFSREAWMASGPEQRGYMVNDLLDKHPLEGMSQDQVLALLGTPDGAMTVTEMYERHKDRYSPEELVAEYGEAVEGRLVSMFYDVGCMGGNPNAPMVLSYVLTLDLQDGVVADVFVTD
jgi:hypothetical protein